MIIVKNNYTKEENIYKDVKEASNYVSLKASAIYSCMHMNRSDRDGNTYTFIKSDDLNNIKTKKYEELKKQFKENEYHWLWSNDSIKRNEEMKERIKRENMIKYGK